MNIYPRPFSPSKLTFLFAIVVAATLVIAADDPSSDTGNDMVHNPRKGRFLMNGGDIIPQLKSVTTNTIDVGIATDTYVPFDYDGDGKTDAAVWRVETNTGRFVIVRSSDQVVQEVFLGQTGDNPQTTRDYDGDGKADPAVYRGGLNSLDPSTWYYKSSRSNAIVATVWGRNGDFVAPGDYDGDGRSDFGVQRNAGGGNGLFAIKLSGGGVETNIFGTPTDVIVPGDYDGDGKTDLAVTRGSGGIIQWRVLTRTGASNYFEVGVSATDFVAATDYNGDGKTDAAVWRPSLTNCYYLVHYSGGPTISNIDLRFEWGKNGDYPTANIFSY